MLSDKSLQITGTYEGDKSMLKYYCYISQSKIDDLFTQTSVGNIEEHEVQKKIDIDFSAKASNNKFSILSLLGADLGYGASGGLQFNKKEKIQYAKKLDVVLHELEKEEQIQVLSLAEPLSPLDSLYYFFTGRFHVADTTSVIESNQYVDGIIKIESDIVPPRGLKISLACSMRYFSDTRTDGKYLIHSGNYHFFKEHAALTLDTVFVVNGFDQLANTIFGSPLFLALSQEKGGRL